MDPPLNPSDEWLSERFRSYYAEHAPKLPDRFARREYGFLFFGKKTMLRHVGFGNAEEFHQFHARRGPAHAYYSTAYYQDPGAPTMGEKGWMGAELIFDLDADHVPGAEKLPFEQQLEKVKGHFFRLVNEFVRGDFGFEERDLLLTFSGGRGYHCHVLQERALELSGQERREIVDYITGTGLLLERFVKEDDSIVRAQGSFRTPLKRLKVPPANSPGWGTRLNQAIGRYFLDLKVLSDERLAEELKDLKGPGGRRLLGPEGLKSVRYELERFHPGQLEGGLIVRPVLMKLARFAVDRNLVVPLAKGETDEPVTSDTKRLIRLPGSLHGKTGLLVVALAVDELETFDPLTQAVAFGDDPIEIVGTKPMEISLRGEHRKLGIGPTTIPEAEAVFAIARGAAHPA